MSILNAVRVRWLVAPLLARGQVAPVLALALLMAACAGPRKAAPPVAAPPPPPAVVVAPQPLPEAAQNRIALLVPLTGANAPVGQSIANAANLALLDVGEKNLNLRVYDTAAGAGVAAQAALRDGAGLILGPLLAADVAPVTAAIGARPVPVISFSNDAGVAESAGAGVYVMGFQPGQAITRVVQFARDKGVARFAALMPEGTYGQRAQTAFVRAVNDAGGRTTAIASYARNPIKMAAAARLVTGYEARIKAGAKPVIRPDGTVARAAGLLGPVPFQALLIADSGSTAAQFMPALARFGASSGSIVVLGTELWNTEPAVRRTPALKGALFAAVPDERFGRLAERYRTRFGSSPSRLASFGYDAVLLVNSLAGRWALGAPFPRAVLNSRDGFAGIDGAFRFTPSGIAERALEVNQVGAGALVTVSPAPRTFGSQN
ncbi:penicillin-binding protein activator [Sandarakinorhabdus sp.]|uniref:penicillin-binding protein activator n=1 Tax=Sandarakinorhabdus sp. TaxID=1916663 RepID=UPI00286DFB62|nr:penicillin-binding protein activator [Sandarakinorhabdus sp.]